MKKTIKSLVAIGLFGMVGCAFAWGFSGSSNAAGASSGGNAMGIAIVDLTQVFQQVPQGQPTFNAYQQKNAPQATTLQNQQKALNDKIQAFQAEKANLSSSQQASQENELLGEQQKLQKAIVDYQTSVQKVQQDMLGDFGNDLKSVVAQVAKQNHYHLVLSSQTALYNDGVDDITTKVIQIMKSESAQ